MSTGVVTLTAAGVSTPIPILPRRFQYGVGILVTIPSGSSSTYTVEVTGDDLTIPGNPVNWNKHDVLQAKSASANSNLAYPVTAVRLNAASVTGSVVMAVIQTEGS